MTQNTGGPLEALIFDVDGTLADTERDGHRVAFNQAFSDSGLDWHWTPELYGRLLTVTGGKERIKHFIATEKPSYDFNGELDDEIARLHQLKTAYYTRLLSEGEIPLRPGVTRLLEEARERGMRLAIATTTTPANVEALLTNSLGPESMGWFDVIAAGDVVPAKKPAPDIYLWAMGQMQMSPDHCLVLEDSDNGVRSARDAGLKSILVTVNGYTREQEFDGATVVLDQLGEADSAVRVLGGDPAPKNGIVDLNYLRDLHAAAWTEERKTA